MAIRDDAAQRFDSGVGSGAIFRIEHPRQCVPVASSEMPKMGAQ